MRYFLYLCSRKSNKKHLNIMAKKTFISWRRVSTKQQGASGLGLDAQAAIIEYFVSLNGGTLLADFQEVHSGKDLAGCSELRAAMQEAKRTKSILIIAKSDRFRNVTEALQVLDDMGEGNIIFCDLPHTDRFTLTLFFALAERERLITSIRTKQALKEKKTQLAEERAAILAEAERATETGDFERAEELQARAKTKKLGRPDASFSDEQRAKSKATITSKARSNENNVRAWFAIKDKLRLNATQLALFLNSGGFPTSKGGKWQAIQVQRLIKMFAE